MFLRPLDGVFPLDCRDLQALDHSTGEKVATAGRRRWGHGISARANVGKLQLGLLRRLRLDTKEGWDRPARESYP